MLRGFTSERLARAQQAEVPRARGCPASAVAGGNVFVFGGCRKSGRVKYNLNDFWSGSLTKGKWEKIESSSEVLPSPRFNASMSVSDDQKAIYLFGGCAVSYVILNSFEYYRYMNDLWKFDIETRKWSCVCHHKKDGAHHISAIYGNKLNVFGGTRTGGFDFVEVFDLAREIWTSIPVGGEKPCDRVYEAWVVHNNHVYVHGGITHSDELLSDFFVLDLETYIWTKLQPLGIQPSARLHHCCCLHGSYLHLFGGLDKKGALALSDLYAYDIECNRWLPMKFCGGELPSEDSFMMKVDGNSIDICDTVCGLKRPSVQFYRFNFCPSDETHHPPLSTANSHRGSNLNSNGLRRRKTGRVLGDESTPLLGSGSAI